MRRIFALTDARNAASNRLLLRSGFHEEERTQEEGGVVGIRFGLDLGS